MKRFITLKTEKCIVTGEPATCWTGHVLAETLGSSFDGHAIVAVIAGFANKETIERTPSDGGGCYGEWKKEFGVFVDA